MSVPNKRGHLFAWGQRDPLVYLESFRDGRKLITVGHLGLHIVAHYAAATDTTCAASADTGVLGNAHYSVAVGIATAGHSELLSSGGGLQCTTTDPEIHHC